MKRISNPLNKFIYSIDKMTITKKTTLLFLNMLIGMLFLGSFAHLSLNRIKGDFDILFTKRMVPVIKLEKIKDIYTVNILDTLRDVEKKHINMEDGKSIILLAQELIKRNWNEYKTSLKIDESDWILDAAQSIGLIHITKKRPVGSLENDMIETIEKKVDKIDIILLKMFDYFDQRKIKDSYTLLQEDLYPSINSINIQLTQLISLNLEAANNGKQRTEAMYDNTFEWILAATVGTIFVAALLALVILQNIRHLHDGLAKRVDEKTKELRELNRNLEKKIAHEVEQSRQKDEIMFRQSRLASMGEMIGNIAHQWRQPLNALVLIIQSFQMKRMVGKLDDEFIDKQVDEGIKLAASMSKTIDDFRNFFKPNKKEEYFSVKETIRESICLVGHYYEKLEIDICLSSEEDFETLGYPNEFSQVMMNLFSNSKDVLKEKENQNKHIEVVVKIDTKKNKGMISVIDNGGGISEEVQDRMFEPYFTTKHQSNGTGIGLYMSREIIEKQMNGSIWSQNISYQFSSEEKVYEKCACITIVVPIETSEQS